MEKKIIEGFLVDRKISNHLDFASGTGRIAHFLEKNTKEQYLIDASKKMLDHAKKILDINKSIFINEDFNKINLNKKFDLITAFRFFPNAEIFLRNEAMKFISEHLDDGGLLIINNHHNYRFALCKFLNINEIIISIKAIHHSLLKKNDIKKILNSNNSDEIKSFLREKIISNI